MRHLRSFGEMAETVIHEGKDDIQIGHRTEDMHVCWVCR